MGKFFRLEKIILYALAFLLFCQGRIVLYSFGPVFNEWSSIYLYASDILIVGVIFLWAVREIKNGSCKDLIKQLAPWKIILAVFLLISGLSLVVSSNVALSFYGWLKIIEVVALFFYAARNFSRLFNLNRFWQIFVASAALQSLVAIAQFFKQGSLGLKYLESPLGSRIDGVAKITVGGEKIIRAYGLVPHPNILAAILIVAIFGLAYLFIDNYKKHCHPELDSGSRTRNKTCAELVSVFGMTKKEIVYLVVLIVLVTALFLTFSRTITIVGISLLFFWAAIIYLRQKNHRRPILIFIGILTAVFCLLAIVYWPLLAARYDLGEMAGGQALNLRVYYNKIAWGLIRDGLVLGVGQGNFVWTSSNLALLPAWMYQPAHNIYLLIGAEVGIFGLAAFILFLLALWWRAVKAKIPAPANCFVYIFYFIIAIGLADHFWWDLQQGQIMFWLFLGILASLSYKFYGSSASEPHSSS